MIITLAFLAACVYLIATGHGIEGTVLGADVHRRIGRHPGGGPTALKG